MVASSLYNKSDPRIEFAGMPYLWRLQ